MKWRPDESIDLPASFHFCVSTAAHQIEGSNFNSDWWHFEQTPGNIKNGQEESIEPIISVFLILM